MGRGLRSACPSNIYHIYTRGVSGHVLFEHPDDKRKLLYQLEDSLDAYGGKLLAYCLMGNHFHLVINHNIEGVSKVVGVTKSRYARYYNHCYDRYGHLYQGRFGYTPIVSDAHLLTAIRYVHLNPVAEGLTFTCNYDWSSYREIVDDVSGARHHTRHLVDTELALAVFGSYDNFAHVHREGERIAHDASRGKTYLDTELEDTEAIERIKGEFGLDVFKRLNESQRAERDEILQSLKRLGYSQKRIARVTGLGESIIRRAWRSNDASGARHHSRHLNACSH